ncbi:hypothetical protein SAMN05444580_101759 [Rhodococcus tukisamuensis]|uniref:Uncharacterized protein n=1 Tax=Rhodococcus tukisamuensis TaxID=168276 RepID=A0A1G6P2K6_9NOCA|nr:hypothetical protein SAMN05444580_101759 [Rhodococcus tukisamuensis]
MGTPSSVDPTSRADSIFAMVGRSDDDVLRQTEDWVRMAP